MIEMDINTVFHILTQGRRAIVKRGTHRDQTNEYFYQSQQGEGADMVICKEFFDPSSLLSTFLFNILLGC